MEILLLIAGVLVSTLSEYLAAALLDLRQVVFNSLAEEGSSIGQRFRSAYDEIDEVALSISLIDILGVMIATIALLTLWDGEPATIALEIAGFIVVVTLLKVTAATVGTRYAEHFLKFTSLLLVSIRVITYPALLMHRVLMRLTHRTSDEEEAREELEAFVETAREEGALDPSEYRIMTKIMRLSSVYVSEVMRPWRSHCPLEQA